MNSRNDSQLVGIVQFTRSCACAWAADNIQAIVVLPGWVDTDLTRRAREQIDGLHDGVHRLISPVSRCFSHQARLNFVTGTAIPVDGGFSIMG